MPDDMVTPAGPQAGAPGLGSTQRRLLDAIKRRGRITLADACSAVGLSLGAVREHMNALAAKRLVEQVEAFRQGPGRPQLVFTLTDEGHALFPQRAHEVLSDLVTFLLESGHEVALRKFLEERVALRFDSVKARVASLRGRRRAEEIAKIMSEDGFMAELEESAAGRQYGLRLCHCPFGAIVAKTNIPCRLEIEFIERLLQQSLERTSFIPDGAASCSYAVASKKRAAGA